MSVDLDENDFNREIPKGLRIIVEKGQQILSVDPNIEFDLSIVVFGGDKIEAIATTIITIDGKPNFSKEITKFFDNENYKKNKEELVGNWSSIISERIPNNEESVVSTR